tara:strand:+ start:360 stop:581 length:222 start_codon:yes stop_codon:yes gene_type:complete
MQKLINVLSVTSFIVSAAVVGAGTYVYLNKDALVEQVKEYGLAQVKEILPIPTISELGSFEADAGVPEIKLPF